MVLGIVGASQAGGISLPGRSHAERGVLRRVAQPAAVSPLGAGQGGYDRSKYRGFGILVRSYQLAESKLWTGDLDIRRKGRWQPFRVNERYQTQQEAYDRCTDLARRIIDGEVPGWSVDHLRHTHPAGRAVFRAWKRKSTRPFIVAGIVILALGAFLFLGEGSFLSRRDSPTAGGPAVTADEQAALPRWVGGACMAMGAAFMVFAARKRL